MTRANISPQPPPFSLDAPKPSRRALITNTKEKGERYLQRRGRDLARAVNGAKLDQIQSGSDPSRSIEGVFGNDYLLSI